MTMQKIKNQRPKFKRADKGARKNRRIAYRMEQPRRPLTKCDYERYEMGYWRVEETEHVIITREVDNHWKNYYYFRSLEYGDVSELV